MTQDDRFLFKKKKILYMYSAQNSNGCVPGISEHPTPELLEMYRRKLTDRLEKLQSDFKIQ